MSLSRQLREAAIERSLERGDDIDYCVIDLSGVIDLRELGDSGAERSSTLPAEALIGTLGGFEHETDVTDLYSADPRRLDLRLHRRSH